MADKKPSPLISRMVWYKKELCTQSFYILKCALHNFSLCFEVVLLTVRGCSCVLRGCSCTLKPPNFPPLVFHLSFQYNIGSKPDWSRVAVRLQYFPGCWLHLTPCFTIGGGGGERNVTVSEYSHNDVIFFCYA